MKYAIAFPGNPPAKFDTFETALLEQSNKEWCIIYQQNDSMDFDMYGTIVLYSEIPLTWGKLIPTRSIWPFQLFDLPKMIDKKAYKEQMKMLIEMYPSAKQMAYYPALGYFYVDRVFDEPFAPMSADFYNWYVAYYQKYQSLLKEIFVGSALSSQDVQELKDFQSFGSFSKLRTLVQTRNAYDEHSQQCIAMEPNDDPMGDILTVAFMHCNRDTQKMMRFLNEHMDTHFAIDQLSMLIEESKEKDSQMIYEGDSFRTKGFSYVNDKWPITDFIVKVRYVVVGADLGRKYVVDFIGDRTVEGVEYPNNFSKQQFKQKISYFGDFHFTGAEGDIGELHKAVTSTSAPEIFPLLGFGFHGDLIACENLVYNTKTKTIYDRDGFYYFNEREKKWYVVIDAQNTNLLMTSSGLPNLNFPINRHEIGDYMDYFSQFYKDEFGVFLLFYILWLIYAGRFRHVTDFKFPFLLLNGKFWSGKSAISDMIKRVYGIRDLEKGQTKYGETSAFALLNIYAYRKWFPVFVTEFKEQNEDKWDAKVSNLVSMYDRAVVAKGTASQKLIYYYLNALAVMDWEELPKRSALKSRSIISYINASNNALSPEIYKERMNDQILKDLFGDAVTKTVEESDYRRFMSEGIAFFNSLCPGSSARIAECYAGVYAGVLAFDPSMKEDAEHYLKDRFIEQNKTEVDTYGTGELLDIIRKYSKQLEYGNAFDYDISTKRFYLYISELETFLLRYHVRLSLGFDALKTYLPRCDLVENPSWWLVEAAIWDMDLNFPKQLMFHPIAYRDYKDLIKKSIS